jgi:hypothetical protein
LDFWAMELQDRQPIGSPYLVKANVGKDTIPWS